MAWLRCTASRGAKAAGCGSLCAASGGHGEVQSQHALELVGQCVPQQHGAHLAQATHIQALQATVAQMRVAAFDTGRALLVDLLGLPGCPCADAIASGPYCRRARASTCHVGDPWAQAAQRTRCSRAASCSMCSCLGQASIGEPLLGRPGVALSVLFMHGQHLLPVAARVDDVHAGDEHGLAVQRQLCIEGRAKAAVSHLHHPRIAIAGAGSRLLGLPGLSRRRLGFWRIRTLFVHLGLDRRRLLLPRIRRNCLCSRRLAGLARAALVERLQRAPGLHYALLALCGSALARRTHAPRARCRIVIDLLPERSNLALRLYQPNPAKSRGA